MHTRQEYLQIARYEPYKVGHLVGFDKLSELHNQWMVDMLYGTEDVTLLAHRLSYKTTCVSVVLAMLIAFRPSCSTLFMRKTDKDTVEIIAQVKKILQSERFQEFAKTIMREPLIITRSNSTEIDTNFNCSPRGTSQLLGIGTSGSLTGKHYDYIFTDDIVNLQDRISTAQRERVKLVYNELQNIRTHGGRVINTGTPWHRQDAISMLMPNVQRYDCYSTGIMSKQLIEEKRKSMPPSLFAANYELKHIAAQDALFKTPPQFFDNPQLMREGIAHVDASYGGQDFTAFTCGCYDEANDIIYMYGRMWHKHIDDVIEVLIGQAQRLMCAPVYCQDNGDKGYLHKQFRRFGVYSRAYTERQNKVVKISSYLRKWWDKIRWLEGTDRQYLDQILDYTENAQHDDAPDSAACICRLLDKNSPPYVD